MYFRVYWTIEKSSENLLLFKICKLIHGFTITSLFIEVPSDALKAKCHSSAQVPFKCSSASSAWVPKCTSDQAPNCFKCLKCLKCLSASIAQVSQVLQVAQLFSSAQIPLKCLSSA